MDVLSAYRDYRASNRVFAELFIPWEDRAAPLPAPDPDAPEAPPPIPDALSALVEEPSAVSEHEAASQGDEGTPDDADAAASARPWFFEALNVAAGAETLPKCAMSLVPFHYRAPELGERGLSLLLVFPPAAPFPVSTVAERLAHGKRNLRALTFCDPEITRGAPGSLDLQAVDPKVFETVLVIDFAAHPLDPREGEKAIPFHLVVPYGFLKLLIGRATETVQVTGRGAAELLHALQKWMAFVMDGMDAFPWRFDVFFSALAPPERQDLVFKLLRGKFVNEQQFASLAVDAPALEPLLAACFSATNRKSFQEQVRFFKAIQDPAWFQAVTYSVKIAVGHLVRAGIFSPPSLSFFRSFREAVENIMDAALLEERPLSSWIASAAAEDLDVAAHRLGTKALAQALGKDGVDPAARARLESLFSRQGQADLAGDAAVSAARPDAAREQALAQVALARALRDLCADRLYQRVLARHEKSHGFTWWLGAVADHRGLARLYAEGGFPLFSKAFHRLPNLDPFEAFFEAIPAPAADIIRKCASGELNAEEPVGPEARRDAQREIIRWVLRLHQAGRLSLDGEADAFVRTMEREEDVP